MVARRLLLALGVLALVAGVWFLATDGSPRGGHGAMEEHGSAGAATVAEGAPFGVAPRTEGERRREDVEEREAEPIERRRVVRGRVLGEDGRPLAGIGVVFQTDFTRSPVIVEAGEGGRFETTPLAVGKVWTAHKPSGTGLYRAVWLPMRDLVRGGGTSFELPPGEGPFEYDLVFRRPPSVLDVLVLDENGTPAAEIGVRFQARSALGPDDEERDSLQLYGMDTWARGETLSWHLWRETDEAGRVHLALWPMERFLEGELFAGSGNYEVTSSPLRVEAPFVPGLRTLTVLPSGGLEVLVLDPDGSPRSGPRVWLESPGRASKRHSTIVSGGIHRFESVPLGPCRILVENPFTGTDQEESTEIESGTRQRVVVDLEDGARRVVLEGGLVDENGLPLAEEAFSFEYSIDGGPFETGFAEEGRFVAWAEPGSTVLVRGILGPWTQPFEPREIRAPSGTRGLIFRRSAMLPTVKLEWTALDASTGEPIEAALILDRGEGTEAESFEARDRQAEALAHPDLRWKAIAVGYLETGGLVRDQVEGEWGDTLRLHAELTRGFELDLQLLDAETQEPIPGMVFSSETAPSVTSDLFGRVRLTADHWPTYKMSHPDYETFEFPIEEEYPYSWTDPRWFLWRRD